MFFTIVGLAILAIVLLLLFLSRKATGPGWGSAAGLILIIFLAGVLTAAGILN